MSDDSSYNPAWWLPGGHAKTIWGRVLRRTERVRTHVVTLQTPDGDFLELVRLPGRSEQPHLLLLHGLEGSPRSHYVRAFFAEAQRMGWTADLMVFRSCGSRMNLGRRFYHSGETGDLDLVLRHVLQEFPRDTFVLAGVSLGGNVVLKWLGERGDDIPGRVAAAVAISVPFDLARSSRRINTGFSRLYQRVFLKTLLRKAADIRSRHPDLLVDVNLRAISTMWDFDDKVTAPIHGFAGAQDYYTRSSSLRWLDRIRIPTLLLGAADDPFLPADVLRDVQRVADGNKVLNTEFVRHGGHAGFVGGAIPFRPTYYAERRACRFLQAVASGLRQKKAQII